MRAFWALLLMVLGFFTLKVLNFNFEEHQIVAFFYVCVFCPLLGVATGMVLEEK